MQPAGVTLRPAVAVIDEQVCIGCTLCIQACPVDAIVGAAKLMHTVIAEACTGCELCVPPCPVDCISIEPTAPLQGETLVTTAQAAQRRFETRNARLERAREEEAVRAAARREAAASRRKRETIAKVLARAKERLERR